MDKPVSYVTAGEIARKKKKEKKMTSVAETVPVLNVEACDHFSKICQKYFLADFLPINTDSESSECNFD